MQERNEQQKSEEINNLLAIIKKDAKENAVRYFKPFLPVIAILLISTFVFGNHSLYPFGAALFGFIFLCVHSHRMARVPKNTSALIALSEIKDTRVIEPFLDNLYWYSGHAYLEQAATAAILRFLPLIEERRAGINYGRVVDLLLHNLSFLSLDPSRTVLQKAVLEALTRLLPGLQKQDALHIASSSRRKLMTALNAEGKIYPATDFILAILKAVEQIGGREQLPIVATLAKGRGLAWKNGRIQQAAQECLKYLRERLENPPADQILLRASDGLSNDTLLRPTETQPDLLLRAATQEPHEQEEKNHALQHNQVY